MPLLSESQYRLLFAMELSVFFRHKRILHFVPLLMFGVFLMAWISPIGSPFAPIVIIVVAGLEIQFNNIFFRSPNELEAMKIFPISWREIILIKNITTITLFLFSMIVCSMALLYFSPDRMNIEQLGNASLYCWTVIFPLLAIGNTQSLHRARRETGLQMDDLMEAIWMLVNLSLVSVPFYCFVKLFDLPILCLVYGIAMAWYWYAISVPHTAGRIEKESTLLCNL